MSSAGSEFITFSGLVALVISIISAVWGYGRLKQQVEYSEQKDKQQDETFETYRTNQEKAFNDYKKFVTEKLSTLESFANQAKPALNHYDKVEDEILQRIRATENLVAKMEQELSSTITMIEADNRYVNKEVFNEFRKHMDERFGKLDKEVGKLDNKLDTVIDMLKKGGSGATV